jgi:hypothetical protein
MAVMQTCEAKTLAAFSIQEKQIYEKLATLILSRK